MPDDQQVNAPASSHGGAFRKPRPTLIVIHSLEAPPVKGMANSLARGWLQRPNSVSVHAITGPDESIDMVGLGTIAYHVGSSGNMIAIGDEHTGYAAFSSAQWHATSAYAGLRNGAEKVAAQAKELGIPLRWLSIAQIRAGERGICTHFDITLAFPGTTTHTDPGRNFPAAEFLQMCRDFQAGTAPAPAPAPTPAPPTPQQQEDEDDEMYLKLVRTATDPNQWWLVNPVANTKKKMADDTQKNYYKAMWGIPENGDVQAPQVLAGYKEIGLPGE